MVSKSGQVHGWPIGGFPAPQGPFYCGVGSESVYGRQLAEAHMDACIRVSLSTYAHSAAPASWRGAHFIQVHGDADVIKEACKPG